MTLQTATVEQFIAATPERVWQRISTPEGIARWWRPGDIAPVVGHEFTLDMGRWGQVPCRVLEVRTGEYLAYSYREWELRWTLTAVEGGTLLRLDHCGFDLSNPEHQRAWDGMVPGWRGVVLPRLAEGFAEAA